MAYSVGTTIKSANRVYTIKKEMAQGCYIASMMLSGDLGSLDSDAEFLLVSNQDIRGVFQNNFKKEIVDTLSVSPAPLLVLPYSHQTCDIIKKYINRTGHNGEGSANRYQGQMLGGKPHGRGILFYGDGKKYEGEFVNGLRHGQGTLTMPNGESFKGLFQNDKITDTGVYYDINGQPRKIGNGKDRSLVKLLWSKTWRLFAAIACFSFAALIVWLIFRVFDSGSGVRIRVGGLIAPLVLGWWGIKNLIGFFTNLFTNPNQAT